MASPRTSQMENTEFSEDGRPLLKIGEMVRNCAINLRSTEKAIFNHSSSVRLLPKFLIQKIIGSLHAYPAAFISRASMRYGLSNATS